MYIGIWEALWTNKNWSKKAPSISYIAILFMATHAIIFAKDYNRLSFRA